MSKINKDSIETLKVMQTLFKHGAHEVAEKVCNEFWDRHNQTKECLHCGDKIVSGSGTNRRSHAKFCSDACRVAEMRKRNSA